MVDGACWVCEEKERWEQMVRADEGEDEVVDLPWWFGARLARGCCNRGLRRTVIYLPTSIIDV